MLKNIKQILLLTVFIGQWLNCWTFRCESNSDGFYADPTDCSKFYRCVTGTTYSFNCGPGTHFNPSCDCCDWPYNANCQSQTQTSAPVYSANGYSGQQQQSGYNSNQQTVDQSGYNYRQYGQQPGGQPVTQGYAYTAGQSYDQYQQQQYGQQTGAQSGQSYPDYSQTQSGQQLPQTYGQSYRQQPVNRQYGEYGQNRQTSISGHHQHRHQNQRLPEESQQIDFSQQKSDDSDDNDDQYQRRQRPQQQQDRRVYQKTDRRGEAPVDDFSETSRVRPKPRPKPRINETPDNQLIDEKDDDFDHNFDEPIEEKRPVRPTPKPKSRQPIGQRKRPTKQPEPEDNSDESDEYEVIKTTSTRRPKVPTRKYRIKTTTMAAIDDNEDQDEDNEFSKFGDNEIKTDNEDPGSVDTNKWLIFDDSQEVTTTTTEDPFVTALKGKVPPNVPQKSNRSRIDGSRSYGRRYSTTTEPIITTSMTDTTTIDPFDEEWADFIAGKPPVDDYSYRTTPKPDTKFLTPNNRTDPNTRSRDQKPKDDGIRYFNCTEAGKPCDICENLDWIKYSNIGVKSNPYRSLKFLPIIASKQCYKACSESQQCLAFSYNLDTGMCHIYDQLDINDVLSEDKTNLVVKNPKNVLINDEWIHTNNGMVSGLELYTTKVDNVWDCLHECIKDMANCQAVDYDPIESMCRVFDAQEGYGVNAVKANSNSLQHLSMFADNNKWRFDDIGYKTMANNRPIDSIPVREIEECFYECIEQKDNNCSYVTIEDKSVQNETRVKDNSVDSDSTDKREKICHLFAFTSTPKWIRSKNRSNHSFVISVPKNHSLIQEFPGYTYVGNPVVIKEGLTVDQCREYAENECKFCRKFTAIEETGECALFSDSALLSPAIKEANYTERSGLLMVPKDYEYLAFERIPWKMFTSDVTPYELKGEIDGLKCLQFCLQQQLCVATALVYDTQESSMFCYFFKESDLKTANVTEYENVDLFIKIMSDNEIPGHRVMTNQSNDCSDGKPLQFEDENKNVDKVSDNRRKGSKANNAFSVYSPYDYDFYNGQPNVDDNRESEQLNAGRMSGSTKQRSVRSVDGINRDRADSDGDNNRSIGLTFIDSVRQNARKESVLETIPTFASQLKKRVEMIRNVTQLMPNNSLPLQVLNPNHNYTILSAGKVLKSLRHYLSDKLCANGQELDNNYQCRDISNTCHEIPDIIYADPIGMSRCNVTLVGAYCPVVCRTGYEPTLPRIQCQSTGHRNVWKNARDVKCRPIDGQCELIDARNKSLLRIKSVTRFPDEKLHFISRFDSRKRLPQFAAYVHTRDNNINDNQTLDVNNSDVEERYVANRCKLLDDKQWTINDYNRSDYNMQPILPTNAFRYSPEAQSLVHTMTVIAPQDPFTARGPWRTLENHTLEMLRTRPGIVLSGVCPDTIPQTAATPRKAMNIPKCFWRIICVPLSDTEITAGVFYTENTHPISQLEKQSRVEQIRQYRDQRFIAKLLGTDGYRNIWTETYNAFKNVNKGIKSFIHKCAETHKNSADAVNFWERVVNGTAGQVETWPASYKYGLEKSDLKINTKEDWEQRSAKIRRFTTKLEDRDDNN
ncbi:uncharacterized protein LOC128959392 [Oppia nitens]|uniref:uncharacterized protein LOC128959392 n=1 Tax=Oppia nitens TaxID=1686743 RepID=UPI0023DBCCDE|nr:uncharacterized protein LOC128959392 [Oppia nitens]